MKAQCGTMKTFCARLGVLVLLAMAVCVSDTAKPGILPGMPTHGINDGKER